MSADRYTVVVGDAGAVERDRLSAVLERTGRFTVVGRATDGAEVLDLVRALRPDLTILDVDLARLDGLEVLPMLRSDTPDCAVVVMAGVAGTIEAASGVASAAGPLRSLRLDHSPTTLVDELLQAIAASSGAECAATLVVDDAAGTAARSFTVDVCHTWGAGGQAAIAAMLACDAVGSTFTGEAELTLRLLGPGQVRVEVASTTPATPVAARWRELLDHYAPRWGTAASAAGSVVWFELVDG